MGKLYLFARVRGRGRRRRAAGGRDRPLQARAATVPLRRGGRVRARTTGAGASSAM